MPGDFEAVDAFLWFALAVAGLWALHRAALSAERRGWIYYKHRKASPGTAGRAFLEVQSLVEPAVRHVVESRDEDDTEEDDAGEPPVPGSRRRQDGNDRG